MQVKNVVLKGRKCWELDNDALTLTMTQGGGNIAALSLQGKSKVNPMWVPPWKTIEPWQYKATDARKYGIPLLGSICGHNPCLGWFGGASEDESGCGLGVHGEAPVARWKLTRKSSAGNTVSMTAECLLKASGMKYSRTLSSKRDTGVITIKERIQNLNCRDMPFTMCQHVTLGPPFLEKDVTVFDTCATKCHTFPGAFSDAQRLKSDTAYIWPEAPGAKGEKVDMRLMSEKYKVSSDFSAQLMNPKRGDAWFSAVNPRLGVMVAYVWNREDFPWLGIWEESYARQEKPWSGKALTRGMEFANTPFPTDLQSAVALGKFQGQPTFRWLPAKGKIDIEYSIIMMDVENDVKGVVDIWKEGSEFNVRLMS